MTSLKWGRSHYNPYSTVRTAADRAAQPRGITNDQARELARLQRAAGERYSGAGLTARNAAKEIRRLRAASGPNAPRE